MELVHTEGTYCTTKRLRWDFPDGAVNKNPPANAGDERDAGSVSGSGLRIDLGWEWERLEIFPRKLEISREHFM